MPKSLKILIAPLNWGLGHASRSSAVITELLARGHNVVIGADGKSLEFLQNEFPMLKCIRIKDLEVHYKTSALASAINYLNLGLKLYFSKSKEQQILKEVQKHEQFDIIISDNRYGLFLKDVHSIIITHQLNIQTPFLSAFVNKLVRKFVGNFNTIWVPDFEGSLLSGELSKASLKNKTYIGPLSRFKFVEKEKSIDVLFLLSGPEPQRSVLEKSLSEILRTHPYPFQEGIRKIVFVRGTKQKTKTSFPNNVKLLDFASKSELEDLINSSKKIVCAGGYSTIMDLVFMKTSALLIPTPHQWEQEYLAEYLTKKGWFAYTTLPTVELTKPIPTTAEFPKNNLLEKALEKLELTLGAK